MVQNNDNVRTFSFHLGNEFLGCLDDVFRDDFAFQVRFIPLHNLRRDETDHADFHSLFVTVRILHFFIENDVRREIVFVVVRIIVVIVNVDISVNIRELSSTERFFQIIKSKIKFMVTDCGASY